MQGITTTGSGQCQWIEPLPLESTQGCSLAHEPGCVYCEEHMARMTHKGTALRRRHKDIARAATVQDLGSLFNDVVAELEDAGELEL